MPARPHPRPPVTLGAAAAYPCSAATAQVLGFVLHALGQQAVATGHAA